MASLTMCRANRSNLTLVHNGGVPYDSPTKCAYAAGKCPAGKKGNYSTMLEFQQKSMEYSCVSKTYATGPTVKYCIV